MIFFIQCFHPNILALAPLLNLRKKSQYSKERPVEINEATQTSPFENILVDPEYVLGDKNETENGGEYGDENK